MTLAVFPADRRTAEIRRCAQALVNLQGEAANLFWRREMAAFAARLTEQGVAGWEISHQAALFMNAVQLELQQLFADQDDCALDVRA